MCLSESSVVSHQSWLLKTVAIELRLTSLNRQRSHCQRLIRLLLGDDDDEQTQGMAYLCLCLRVKEGERKADRREEETWRKNAFVVTSRNSSYIFKARDLIAV